MELAVFGIRHHGPGSALRLLQALHAWQPDCLLIEVPADAESLAPYAIETGMKPPVSILIYDPKDFNRAVYLPFAEFSPEWQALQFGLKRQIPVRFMDLPMSMQFGLTGAGERLLQGESSEAQAWRMDPLGKFAELAGYPDGERWWEVTFEHAMDGATVFQAIGEMMTFLRKETVDMEPRETLLREAFMRKTIRKASQDGFGRVAVVCGAWHQPALEGWSQIKPAADNQALRGLAKVKTQCTWVPWSYDRLSRASGYRSGVQSPAWYEMLFSNRGEAVIHWMVRAARLLRQLDLQASSASVIHAVDLTRALAAMRGLRLPGLEELREAGMSVFGDGDETLLKRIDEQLVIGDVQGKVPRTIPVVPIQKDLETQIKSARLTRYRNTTEKITKALDLRVESNLLASRLLHRLHLLEIPWGVLLEGKERQLGTFSERWRLKWKPDFAIRVIEASMWGQTIEEAAINRMRQELQAVQQLQPMTDLVQKALLAGLETIMADLLARLEQLAAQTKDVFALMDAFPALVNVYRYGDARKTEGEAVLQVLQHIFPRICIGLLPASTGIQEEVGRDLFLKILSVNRALGLLQEEVPQTEWETSLKGVLTRVGVQPLVKGTCTRLLFDKRKLTEGETSDLLSFGLSAGQDHREAMQWLEGFLHGSGLILLYHPALWDVLDRFVSSISMERLQEILPMFRRSISHYSKAERTKLFQLALHGRKEEDTPEEAFPDEERKKAVQQVLRQLLGLGAP